MCFGGGGESTSTSEGRASATVEFNPVITIGGNSGEPVADTGSTFAAKLLAAPPVRIALPESVAEGAPDNSTTKLLAFVAIGLVVRRVLRG